MNILLGQVLTISMVFMTSSETTLTRSLAGLGYTCNVLSFVSLIDVVGSILMS